MTHAAFFWLVGVPVYSGVLLAIGHLHGRFVEISTASSKAVLIDSVLPLARRAPFTVVTLEGRVRDLHR